MAVKTLSKMAMLIIQLGKNKKNNIHEYDVFHLSHQSSKEDKYR